MKISMQDIEKLTNEKSVRVTDLTHQGICLYNEEDYESALHCFEQALQFHPDGLIALQLKCLCHLKLEKDIKNKSDIIPDLERVAIIICHLL